MNDPITLETTLIRGDTHIVEIALRKPAAGELRGIKLVDLLQMDVAAITQLLPRITTPTITAEEAGRLDLVDLVALGSELLSFFVPKAGHPASPQ